MCLLGAAAASAKYDDEENDDILDNNDVHVDEAYFNARNWLTKNTPRIIDLTLLLISVYSDGKKGNDTSIQFSTIKVKVKAETEKNAVNSARRRLGNWVNLIKTTNS